MHSVPFLVVTLIALAILMSAVGCNAPVSQKAQAMESQPTSSITGSVTYRPRIALSPEAVVRVTLEHVSKADAPSTVVGETSIVTEGKQVPIPFTLTYPTNAIQTQARYALRATIHVADKLAFTTTTATPFTAEVSAYDLIVSPVSASVPPPGPATVNLTPLEGTYWKLIDIGGTPAVELDGFREAFLQFDAKRKFINGMGGVNGVGGEYEYTGQRSLRIKPGPSTMMAGPEPLMKQEMALRDALGQTDSFRVTGKMLELLAGDQVVARFQSKLAPLGAL